MQRILDVLAAFYAQNFLTVSLHKTEWLVGGYK